jgi:hypothetical protein
MPQERCDASDVAGSHVAPHESGSMHLHRPSGWALAAALLLAACHGAEHAQSTPAPSAPAAADAGAPVLAAVQNARSAIAAGDPIAAFNDVNLGLGFATRLTGAESALYPAEAAPPGYHDPSAGAGNGGGQGGSQGGGSGRRHHGGGHPAAAGEPAAAAPAPPGPSAKPSGRPPGHHAGRGDHGAPTAISSFDAQVKLVSAQAKLQAHDAAGADADLEAVEAAAHAPPANLPLIRADQSLTLASADVAGGRLPQLRTQLTAAQASLEAYDGASHAAEAKALAATIGDALNRPGGLVTLPPALLGLWSGRVDSWV